MTLILSGTDGLSDVDGTAATPAIRGTDANTGIFFGTDIIGFSEGGVESARFNASGVFTTTNDATIQGLTVGKGGGAVATNTAVGQSAMAATATGTENVALGREALTALTSGGQNTGLGRSALAGNTTGSSNTGAGTGSLVSNTTGSYCTSIGAGSLNSNTTASNNTAVGYQAGYGGTTSGVNTYLGTKAGYTGSTGDGCTFVGYQSGYSTTGTINTFLGYNSGNLITSGTKNTIIGGYTGNQDGLDIRTESSNIVLSDGDGNVRMHYRGSDASWKSLAIYNNTTGSGANMTVLSSGTIARSTSSLKYKRDVQDATHGLAEVLQLRPVTYKGKGENDGETVFGGLIAEEVHEAGLTEFVQYAADGSPDALAYGNMVSLMVKAIQEQQALITQLQADVAALKGQP